MKRMIPVLLAMCLLLIPMAQTAAAEQEQQGYSPGSAPAQCSRLEAVQLPVSALVLAMTERELSYDAQSDEFVWDVLYYMLGLFGQFDSRAELTDEALIVPVEAARDCMGVLFAGRTDLPEIPQRLQECIRIQDGCCILALGDFGLAQISLGELEESGDVQYLTGDLVYMEDGRILKQFKVTLAESENMFGFVILNLELV